MTSLSDITRKQKILVMAGVMLGLFLAALDQTIVATAMPRIVQEFQALEHLSWVFTAYMLTSTVTVPIFGKLSDLFGRKNLILFGIVVFIIGSVLCGFSQSMLQLIIFRGIQGMGAGILMSNAFAIIGDLFPPAERGRWQGLFGATFGLASVIGPFVGGWLTDYASWRYTFFINIPLGLFAFSVILWLMPAIAHHTRRIVIDYLGAAAFTVGLVALLLGFVWGGSEYAWNSPQIIGLFTTAVVFLTIFGFIEKKAVEPILPLSLFKNSIFSLSMFIVFLSGIAMFGAILFIPLFGQGVLGISATESGTILTPLMFGMVTMSIIGGQIMTKTGKYKVMSVIGMFIITIALFWLSQVSQTTTQGTLVTMMVFLGMGLGLTMPVYNLVVQNAFDHSQLGVVTASTQLFRSIGGTVGTALMGGVLNAGLNTKLGNLSQDPFLGQLTKINPDFQVTSFHANQIQNLLSSSTQAQIAEKLSVLPPQVQPIVTQSYVQFLTKIKMALASSIAEVFFISAVIITIAFLASFFVREIPLRKTNTTGK